MITHLAAAAASCSTGTWAQKRTCGWNQPVPASVPHAGYNFGHSLLPALVVLARRHLHCQVGEETEEGPGRPGRGGGPAMTEAAQRKAVARPASRLPVSRPVLWTGIALGAFLAGEALLHRLVLPLGLPGFVSAAITAVLIVALAVVAAELTRRHHRTVARHAIRHGKRGAVASARHARRHGGTALQWLVAKAAPRWENREHRPLMFRRLRGERGRPRRGSAPGSGSRRPRGRTRCTTTR